MGSMSCVFALLGAACTGAEDEAASFPSETTAAPAPSTTTPRTTTTTPSTAPPLPDVDLTFASAFGLVLVSAGDGTASQGVLAPMVDDVVVASSNGTEVSRATIADDGRALVRDLPPGPVELVLHRDGSAIATGPTAEIPDDSPPAASFYDEQTLAAGFGYITTRDGTTLSANVTLPGPTASGPYPTLVEYSGYDPSNPGLDDPSRLIISSLGYALVQVNVRGTGCSGGSFDAFEPIQGLDGYDVIETVAAQSWSANVGMWGISYPAIMQLQVAATRPPSLAAIAPLSPLDRIESVLYPGGIYNDGFGEDWADRVGRRAEAFGQRWTRERADAGDDECAANQSLRLHNRDIVSLAKANEFRSSFTDTRSMEPRVGQIDVPVFIAGAWQDEQTGGHFPAMLDDLSSAPVLRATLYNGFHIDPLGPDVLPRVLEFYDLYVAERVPGIDLFNRLVADVALSAIFGGRVTLAPDRFRGMSYEEARRAYEEEASTRVLFEVGATSAALPQASWEASFDGWPAADIEAVRWHLGPNGALATEPTESTGGNEFTTDPTEASRLIGGDLDRLWTNRPDWNWSPAADDRRLIYTSPPATEETVFVGPASADLWIRADAPDVDLEVTLSEIAPDGAETFIQAGRLRASKRALDPSSTAIRPIPTLERDDQEFLDPEGDPVPMRIEILPFAHVIRPGSALRLTIDTPGGSAARWQFDVSGPPTGVEVFHGPTTPSSIVLPVVPGLDAPDSRPSCGSLRAQPCRP